MLNRTIVLGTIAACMLATPIAAQAPAPSPTTTAFDGTYVGVSRTLEGTMYAINNHIKGCMPNGQPGPLTIASGAARWLSYRGDTFEGSVNGQGVLVMHDPLAQRIDAQIDGRGAVTGRFTGNCSFHMVWQKEGK